MSATLAFALEDASTGAGATPTECRIFRDNLDLLRKGPLLLLTRSALPIPILWLLMAVVSVGGVASVAFQQGVMFPRPDDPTFAPFARDIPAFLEGALCFPLLFIFMRKILKPLPGVLDDLIGSGRIAIDGARAEKIARAHDRVGNLLTVNLFLLTLAASTNFLWLGNFYRQNANVYVISRTADGAPYVNLTGYVDAILIVTPCLYGVFLSFYKIVVMVHLFFSLTGSKESERNPVSLALSHEDGAAGFAQVGRLSARSGIPFAALGLVIVAIILKESAMKTPNDLVYYMMGAGYAIAAVVIFLLPLYPFHRGMKRNRSEVLQFLSNRHDALFRQYAESRDRDAAGQAEMQLLARMEKTRDMCSLVRGLPVWPFNWGAIGGFSARVLVPVLAFIASTVCEKCIVDLLVRLRATGPPEIP